MLQGVDTNSQIKYYQKFFTVANNQPAWKSSSKQARFVSQATFNVIFLTKVCFLPLPHRNEDTANNSAKYMSPQPQVHKKCKKQKKQQSKLNCLDITLHKLHLQSCELCQLAQLRRDRCEESIVGHSPVNHNEQPKWKQYQSKSTNYFSSTEIQANQLRTPCPTTKNPQSALAFALTGQSSPSTGQFVSPTSTDGGSRNSCLPSSNVGQRNNHHHQRRERVLPWIQPIYYTSSREKTLSGTTQCNLS